MNINKHIIYILFFIGILCGCGSYNQNLLFQTKDNQSIIGDSISRKIAETEKNYVIRPADQIEVRVYTNNGEKLVDPNSELLQTSGITTSNNNTGANNTQNLQNINYLVNSDGLVRLPMIGYEKVSGLNTNQLDSLLQLKYSKFYNDVYVFTKCVNRRVIVLGSNGGIGRVSGQVVPLLNENMNLIEILAMVGGLDENSKSYNIKLIRGDLKNPNVSIIDLSTIEGMKLANLNIQPGDIIYIERIKKGARQAFMEFSPYLSLLTVVTTLLLIFTRKY